MEFLAIRINIIFFSLSLLLLIGYKTLIDAIICFSSFDLGLNSLPPYLLFQLMYVYLFLKKPFLTYLNRKNREISLEKQHQYTVYFFFGHHSTGMKATIFFPNFILVCYKDVSPFLLLSYINIRHCSTITHTSFFHN